MADNLHDGLPEVLSLDNLANGAAYELAAEALKRLAENIADVNTSATQKRKIVLTVEASPYKDRSGAELSVKIETKLAGMAPAEGMMYVARRNGAYLPFAKNTKQTEIEFGMSPDSVAEASERKPS